MKYVKPLKLYEQWFKQSLKRKTLKAPGRLLGLDIGDDHVALALTDSKYTSASNKELDLGGRLFYTTSKDNDIGSLADELKTLIFRHHVEGFVVGYPFRDEKSDGYKEKIVNIFIDSLNKTGKFEDLKYTYWDKTLTSKKEEIILGNHMKLCKKHPGFNGFDNRSFEQLVEGWTPILMLQGYLDSGLMLSGSSARLLNIYK